MSGVAGLEDDAPQALRPPNKQEKHSKYMYRHSILGPQLGKPTPLASLDDTTKIFCTFDEN